MGKPTIHQNLDPTIFANFISLLGKVKVPESGGDLKTGVSRLLHIKDKQEFVNRFKWFNLPYGITGELIERILFYRGKLMLFYLDEIKKFLVLPFALDGNIDVYGRYLTITPVPFNGATLEKMKNSKKEKELAWIPGLVRNVAYDIILPEELKKEDILDKCVILTDRSLEISQEIIPRHTLNREIIDVEADIIPFMRTALLSATGVLGMKVSNEDESSSVTAASLAMDNAARTGNKYVPIVGSVDFQELAGGNVGKGEEFLEVFQSLDNFRLSTLGLDNGGMFQKKAHMLQSEQESNNSTNNLVELDSLMTRRHFCNVCNSIWGTSIWVEPNHQDFNQQENDDEMNDEGNNNPAQGGSEGGEDE